MKLVLMGPQGSGKGTQTELITQKYAFPSFTLGNYYRKLTKKNNAFGKKIASFIDKGMLVPNDISNKIMTQELKKSKYKKGFILDGYPRNIIQAKNLVKLKNIDAVIILSLSEKESIKRLGGRRICTKCGEIYHLSFNPPPHPERCKCGRKLEIRKDDYPEAIKKRLNIYKNKIKGVIDFMAKHSKIIKINANQDVKDVFNDIKTELSQL